MNITNRTYKEQWKSVLCGLPEQRKLEQTLDACSWCLEGGRVSKNGLLCQGLKTYLALPRHKPLVERQVQIVPMSHVSSLLQADEDIYDEMMIWRKGIVRWAAQRDEDVVFVELAKNVQQSPHTLVTAYPMPADVAADAPLYFKKAILECEEEWADNKKLIDLNKKGLRKSIPKGFSYFAVDFGLSPGYAHIIEKEEHFPRYFAEEILGGMLDVAATEWKRPKRREKEELASEVKRLAQEWGPFDWTERAKAALQQ